MKYSFIGKGIQVTENMKDRFTAKMGRLERILPENADIHATFGQVKNNYTVEVVVPLQKRTLRAAVSSVDVFTAIDEIVDKIDIQMVKYKDRLKKKSRKDHSFLHEYETTFKEEDVSDEVRSAIKKIKRFALKPMDPEEAVMEMDLLGHDFFMFRNSNTDEINVVYSRKDGEYGLIEPEL
ncbi:MAG: ribosome-associated translation inhibitor RaiA [Defluviitaleaceae bacterium]|nr:ribosome-associated translation inhibitor RaiA [Defluviitaleaceae bacterium]